MGISILLLAGLGFAIWAYIPLCRDVYNRTLTQSLATYGLWGLLDAINAGSTYSKGGNYWLPLLYAAMSFAVVAIIFLRNFNRKWELIETICTIFVLASIVVWYFVSDELAIVVSTIGVVVAGLPQLKDVWKDPAGAPLGPYVLFVIANGLSTLAGKDWSIQERLYGSACTVLTITFAMVAAMRWLPKKKS